MFWEKETYIHVILMNVLMNTLDFSQNAKALVGDFRLNVSFNENVRYVNIILNFYN
jgi:hypothetical protein